MHISENNIFDLEAKSELIKTMGHPIRLSIVGLLDKNKELSVTEIFTRLNIEQAVVSHHLRIMKNAGLVKFKKQGKNSNYSITHKHIKKIYNLLINI